MTELNNQTITADIIRQLIDTARQKELPVQYKLLDYEVQEYLLDGENYATNPLNLTAQTVQSNLNLFLSNGNQIENIKKVIRASNFGLSKIVPSGVLSGMAVLNRDEKELGCCLIDIGAGTTDIAVYENGFIRHLSSLPIGGEDITRDLANVLKISRNLAEDIKLNYGGCSYVSSAGKFGEGITLINHRGVNQVISRKLLIDVITERLKDIFEVIKTGLNHHQIYDIINSGIVITGGVAKLPGIEVFASQYFGVPARIGIPNYTSNFADMVTTPSYATCIGVLHFAREYMLDTLDTKAVSVGTFQVSDFKSLAQKFKKLFA
jgi:cell division protein FtsA